jgi:chromosomal replication initiation ATPase DnaA
MESNDEEIVFVVKRLARSIKRHGVQKVVAVLDGLNTEEGFIAAHNSLIKFTITECASVFKVKPDSLKRKNIRGAAVIARSMCMVLIKKHLELTHADICGIFGRKTHTLVSQALKEFSELNYDVKTDRKFLDAYQELDKKVEEQKRLLWLKHS